jgi:hypothetical protein
MSESAKSNTTGPTVNSTASQETGLPALCYIHLDGHFSVLDDSTNKEVKFDEVSKHSVKEVITGINLFISAQASILLRRYAELLCEAYKV